MNIDLTKVKYKKRYKNTKIIFVSPTKLLDRLEKDSESFSMREYKGGVPKHQIGGRVDKAKEWILKNYNNPRALFEPSQVSLSHWSWNEKGVRNLSFGDGRHRVLAAEQMSIPEVAIEIKPSQEKYFDYMRVHPLNMLKESPDYVDKYDLGMRDEDAVPFVGYEENDEIKILTGKKGTGHMGVYYTSFMPKMTQAFDLSLPYYSGRVWLDKKIMSFWHFPDTKIFKQIVNKLEDKLKIKIWNEGWIVETNYSSKSSKKDNLLTYREYWDEHPKQIKFIPVEDYTKGEDFSDAEQKLHLMSSAEKDMLRKAGKDPLKYYKSLGKNKNVEPIDILKNRQLMYQEKMIIKFDDYSNESPDKFDNFDKINENPDVTDYGNNFHDSDALPFMSNKSGTIVNIGIKGSTHGSVTRPDNDITKNYSVISK